MRGNQQRKRIGILNFKNYIGGKDAFIKLVIQWQSQSTTSADSPTGRRYIEQQQNGTRVLLFVREFRNGRAGTAPYTFLGLADYQQHSGSRPLNIIYQLRRPIPAKYLKKTNKLVVG